MWVIRNDSLTVECRIKSVIIVLLVSEAKGSFYSIYLDSIVEKTLSDLLKVCFKVNKNYRQGREQSMSLAAHVAAV